MRAGGTDDYRADTLNVLHETVHAIEKNYYEKSLIGSEFLDRAHLAEERIAHAPDLNSAYSLIGWVVAGIRDSHTQFIPPMRATRTDRGWTAAPIGGHCLLTGVRPGSDAEAQGLKPGDELLAMDGTRTTPDSLARLEYDFDVIAPRPIHELVIQSPGSTPRTLKVRVEFVNLSPAIHNGNDWMELDRKWELDQEAMRPRSTELGDTVILQVPSFNLTDSTIETLFKKVEKHDTVIFDLRDNEGGPQSALAHMLGHLFDHQVKICDRIGRKGISALMARPHGHTFSGKVAVLIDGNSASSAEIFARVVQLEKRGIVVGDHSSGQVAESVSYLLHDGLSRVIFFGVQVTTRKIVMSDGQCLERNPVNPDELLLPTAEDLASGRDPVLSRAIKLGGTDMTPEKAGALFPRIWRRL